MAQDVSQKPLRSYPVQLIELSNAVVIKRGLTEIKFGGTRVKTILESVIALTSTQSKTADELLTAFAKPEHEVVQKIVRHLLNRNILYFEDTPTPDQIDDTQNRFFWHFLSSKAEIIQLLETFQLSILGVNAISKQMLNSLSMTGFRNIEIIDTPMLRNTELFGEADTIDTTHWHPQFPKPITWDASRAATHPNTINCLIATTDRGGAHLLRRWNEYCVEHKLRFYPIVLQDMIGYVGPFIIPGETACYECLRGRQNSHLENPEEKRSIEYATVEGDGIHAFIPPMASILGDIAATELLKTYAGIPQTKVGHLIEVNLLPMKLSKSYVLKLPRCPVCSSLINTATMTVKKSLFMPGNAPEGITP